jgi:hypothetical protein
MDRYPQIRGTSASQQFFNGSSGAAFNQDTRVEGIQSMGHNENVLVTPTSTAATPPHRASVSKAVKRTFHDFDAEAGVSVPHLHKRPRIDRDQSRKTFQDMTTPAQRLARCNTATLPASRPGAPFAGYTPHFPYTGAYNSNSFSRNAIEYSAPRSTAATPPAALDPLGQISASISNDSRQVNPRHRDIRTKHTHLHHRKETLLENTVTNSVASRLGTHRAGVQQRTGRHAVVDERRALIPRPFTPLEVESASAEVNHRQWRNASAIDTWGLAAPTEPSRPGVNYPEQHRQYPSQVESTRLRNVVGGGETSKETSEPPPDRSRTTNAKSQKYTYMQARPMIVKNPKIAQGPLSAQVGAYDSAQKPVGPPAQMGHIHSTFATSLAFGETTCKSSCVGEKPC